MRPNAFRFGLRVLGNDGPAAEDNIALFRLLAVGRQAFHVGVHADTACAQEAIGDPRSAIDRRRGHPPKQNLRRPIRLRCDLQITHSKSFALEVHGLARPTASENFDALLDQTRSVGNLATKLVELQLPIADTHAEIESPTRNER